MGLELCTDHTDFYKKKYKQQDHIISFVFVCYYSFKFCGILGITIFLVGDPKSHQSAWAFLDQSQCGRPKTSQSGCRWSSQC